MDRMVPIGHNNHNNFNSRNGCTANNVYCFIGYYGCNCFNSHDSCNDQCNGHNFYGTRYMALMIMVNLMASTSMSDAIL